MDKSFVVQFFNQDLSFSSNPSPILLKAAPTFASRINGGHGQCVVDLNLPFDDFGEGTTIGLMKIADIYAIDANHPRGRRIYRGFVTQYEPYLEGGREGVKVTLLGLASLLTLSLYKTGGGSVTVSHTTDDPEAIVRAVIDHFNTVYGGNLITYTDGTTDPIGVVPNVTFESQKWFDSIRKTLELAEAGWWWKVDHDGLFWFKPRPSDVTHQFTLKDDVDSVRVTKNSEKVVNEVYLKWSLSGTPQTTHIFDLPSQAAFGTGSPPTGVRTKVLNGSSVNDGTSAGQAAQKELDDNKVAKTATQLVINEKYDLESIHVGEMCEVLNYKKGSTLFEGPMIIAGLTYTAEKVTLDLEQPRDFGLELQSFVG